ncbi:MAG: hypothetical protein QUV05_20945 [Phycisphaerae bacterium]|nr:hypothetical protein [Phycisphaerae bacterium]
MIMARAPWPLFIFGGVGTGKTCACLCLLDAAGGGCHFKTFPELCNDIIAAGKGDLWNDNTGYRMSVHDYWHVWRNSRLTVLDEIGARQQVSDFAYETLKLAIDTREGKCCVFTSNIGPDDLARIYDDRIASRLTTGTVLELGGADRRQRVVPCENKLERQAQEVFG